MIDEHTRESLLNIVERSITAERLVTELEKRSTRQVGRRRCCGSTTGQNWFRKRCNASARTSPAWSMSRRAVGQRLHRIVQQRTTQGVPQPQPLDHPVRGSGGRRRLQARAQPPTPPLSAGLPHAGRVRCGMQASPHTGGLRDQLNPEQTTPTLESGGLSNGDSPKGPGARVSYRRLNRCAGIIWLEELMLGCVQLVLGCVEQCCFFAMGCNLEPPPPLQHDGNAHRGSDHDDGRGRPPVRDDGCEDGDAHAGKDRMPLGARRRLHVFTLTPLGHQGLTPWIRFGNRQSLHAGGDGGLANSTACLSWLPRMP